MNRQLLSIPRGITAFISDFKQGLCNVQYNSVLWGGSLYSLLTVFLVTLMTYPLKKRYQFKQNPLTTANHPAFNANYHACMGKYESRSIRVHRPMINNYSDFPGVLPALSQLFSQCVSVTSRKAVFIHNFPLMPYRFIDACLSLSLSLCHGAMS